MKKILSILFVLISISISYSSDSKDSSPKKSNKVKYISKFNTNLDKNIVECYFDEKNNTFNYKKNGVIISKNQYKSKEDFIKERQNFGMSFYISLIYFDSSKKYIINLEYEKEYKLIKEDSDFYEVNYYNHDLKKRNIFGKKNHYGVADNIIIQISYDDNFKISTHQYSYPEGVIEKHPNLKTESIRKYDDYNNLISVIAKSNKGIIYEEIKNVISYSEIE